MGVHVGPEYAFGRKLPEEELENYRKDFKFYERVLKQGKNKIYSLHEPQVYCIAKGKDHKPYEYGAKASIVSTTKGGVILSAVSRSKNIHDNRYQRDKERKKCRRRAAIEPLMVT